MIVKLAYCLLKQSHRGFIRLSVVLAVVGMVLGITTLVAISAIMNGIQDELRSKLFGIAEHVVVRFDGYTNVQDKKWLQHPAIVRASPFLVSGGLLQYQQRSLPALVLGIQPENVDYSQMVENPELLQDLKPGAFHVIMGKSLAQALNWSLGRQGLLMSQASKRSLFGDVQVKRLQLQGLLMFQAARKLEEKMAFLHLNDLQAILGLSGQISGYNLHLHDMYQAPKLREKLSHQLAGRAVVTDWTEQYDSLFSALRLQKTVMVVFLALLLVVALFNLVSGQVMLVYEHRRSIAILLTLGMRPWQLMAIFLLQALVLASLALVIGCLLGYFLAENIGDWVACIEKTYHVNLISDQVYLLDHLPSRFDFVDVLWIALATWFLTVLASWYPARLAKQTHPAEVLRYVA